MAITSIDDGRTKIILPKYKIGDSIALIGLGRCWQGDVYSIQILIDRKGQTVMYFVREEFHGEHWWDECDVELIQTAEEIEAVVVNKKKDGTYQSDTPNVDAKQRTPQLEGQE